MKKVIAPKKGDKYWLKFGGKKIRSRIVKVFKGVYYKGEKKIGNRMFVELKAGSKNYILTFAELKSRATKRRL